MPHPTYCARCNAPLRSSTMSKFNTDIICTPCEMGECDAPGYAAAAAAEAEAVRDGDFNFSGVGLLPEDRTFLAAHRKERGAQ
jgi:hypothetical protein